MIKDIFRSTSVEISNTPVPESGNGSGPQEQSPVVPVLKADSLRERWAALAKNPGDIPEWLAPAVTAVGASTLLAHLLGRGI